jgi:hypothetical protein
MTEHSDLEIAWAAGIIEGEGCFSYNGRSQYGDRRYQYPRIEVRMTDPDVIARLQRIFGGNVRACNNHIARPEQKQQFTWDITNMADFDRVAALIRPWLGARRRARLDEIASGYRGYIGPRAGGQLLHQGDEIR